jgi:hypothetical protein
MCANTNNRDLKTNNLKCINLKQNQLIVKENTKEELTQRD